MNGRRLIVFVTVILLAACSEGSSPEPTASRLPTPSPQPAQATSAPTPLRATPIPVFTPTPTLLSPEAAGPTPTPLRATPIPVFTPTPTLLSPETAGPTPTPAPPAREEVGQEAASCNSLLGAVSRLRQVNGLVQTQGEDLGLAGLSLQAGVALLRGDFKTACELMDQAMALLGVPVTAGSPTPTPLLTTSVKSSRPAVLEYVDRPPPIASLITIGAPGTDGATTVTGAPGAVPGPVDVMVVTVEYSDPAFVVSAPDGSFNASVTSAPGATVQVRHNPYPLQSRLIDGLHQKNHWPGTLLRVADAPASGAGSPFSAAGATYAGGGPVFWAVEGSVSNKALQAGGSVSLSGSVRVYIPAGVVAPSSLSDNEMSFGIDKLFDAEGRQSSAGADFVSRFLTPTGLPIERQRGPGFARLSNVRVSLRREGDAYVAAFDANVPISAGLPDGTYRLYASLGGPGIQPLGNQLKHSPEHHLGFGQGTFGGATVALLTIGQPKAPKLAATLLVDNPNQGSRGVIAENDRAFYGFSGRIATQADVFLVQPRNPGDGQLIPYNLEPFMPFLSLADRNLPNAPVVPLDLPGGTLTVTVHTPSGINDVLGTETVLQTRTGEESTSTGRQLNEGGGHPGGVLQLTTLSDAFVYRFAEYGRYTISLSGSVSDVWGQSYPFSGSFQVWSAETLDIETASLPSTPFQAGDKLPAVVNIYPGVPAEVEMSLELIPIDGGPKVEDSVTGIANRFGYFDGAGRAFDLSDPGEYLARVKASYTDEEGRLWLGTRRWGSGIAPASPTLIAHGRRGLDDGAGGFPPGLGAWMTRASTGVPTGSGHISFPFFSGDVVWATDDDAVQIRVTAQDPSGQIAGLLGDRAEQSASEGPSFLERQTAGELPLFISTSSGLEASLALDDIDQWGYAYRAVERPGVRVREMVGTEQTKAPYWRFNDQYLAQRGMGSEGDLPNDIKWQFAATVFKRPDRNIGEVAIYGSLWVEIDDDDPEGSRVFPPFQGAAGGPTGGPIMTLKGEEIDLFLMPTAIRPGAILEVGDSFVFAGQVGPPLASKVTARVTSPGGEVRTVSGRANSVGYFSDPTGDFMVNEPGIWTVEVEVLHDGLTSAGPVEPPFPTGGVLGGAEGRFQIYVVPKESGKLDFGLPSLSFAANPARTPLSFFPRIPDSWTDVEGVYIISMPGFILDKGSLKQSAGASELVYDPSRLSRDFPNIDLRARHVITPGLSDEVFISVLISGTDASGGRQYAAKHLTLVGEDIYDKN